MFVLDLTFLKEHFVGVELELVCSGSSVGVSCVRFISGVDDLMMLLLMYLCSYNESWSIDLSFILNSLYYQMLRS